MNSIKLVKAFLENLEHEGITIVEEDLHTTYHVNVDSVVGYIPQEPQFIDGYSVKVLDHSILGPNHAYLKIDVVKEGE